MEEKITLLTLNCWGLPDWITKRTKHFNSKIIQGSKQSRIVEIGKRIGEYDVVCLREVWSNEDRETLKRMGVDNGLPYSHAFTSGMLGSSGLQILSRFPIVEVFFYKYRVNGQVIRLDHGDFWAGKGFGYAKIQLPKDRLLSVL